MQYFILLFLLFFTLSSWSQTPNNSISASTPQEMRTAVEQHQAMYESSWLKEYPIRSIGPTVMSGRVVDIAQSNQDKDTYYVAYASGGVFKTTNNGISFQPIFDHQGRLTVGDIAVHPQNDQAIWVGTGENNSSRSSYAGYGIYKSEDGGKTWQMKGLENIQHTGRIVLHPTDENILWVASIGGLYSKDTDRGLYKSTDGGETWNKTLLIDENTGIIDLIINPENPDQLWAAAWERHREAWEFIENGAGSGLYTSEDGGETWNKVTNGLPDSQWMGRIGLDICQSQPNVLYLVLDNQEEVPKEEEEDEDLTFKKLRSMSESDFLALTNEKVEDFLRNNGFPKKYTADVVKQEINQGSFTYEDLVNYYSYGNDDLFNTEIRGLEVYRSNDYGQSWQKVNSYAVEGVFFTYGYYFGQIRVSPTNPDLIYVFGVPLLRSEDGGKTYESIATFEQNESVHADHHAMLIDPQNPDRILLGNDGGLYVSHDAGDSFLHLNNVAVGQFYSVMVDMEQPYNVYGGLQDNGTYMGSSKSIPNKSKEWEFISGGDGMLVAVDPRNNQKVYTGYQFGNYFRTDKAENDQAYISPRHDIGEAPLRFNWRTPLIMSLHNPDILYMGAQKIYRSMNQGQSWESISPDLSKDLKFDNVPYSTLSCIEESPLKFNLLYAGTDDGLVQMSKDGGATWQVISDNLPQDRWVSSICASPHEEASVFVTLTGYRQDEINSYIFKSEDYGQSWVQLKGNLPEEAVNVILQDPVNPDLLYLGTDLGAYLSWDAGTTWHILPKELPNVAVYDLLVHPRENELVLATHGRSMYVIDVKPLQALKEKEENAIVAFEVSSIRFNEKWGEKTFEYLKAPEPEVNLMYFVGTEKDDFITIEIQDEERKVLQSLTGEGTLGFHQLTWNGKLKNDEYIPAGKYQIIFKNGKEETQLGWEVKD